MSPLRLHTLRALNAGACSILAVALAIGCGGASAPVDGAADAQRRRDEERLADLQQRREEHERTIRELEARLAMSQAEVRDLRDTQGHGPLRQTVRIGDDGWNEPGDDAPIAQAEPDDTEEDRSTDGGPRPVLRLYGDPAERSVEELSGRPDPPLIIPAAPAGLPTRLAVSPLPGQDQVPEPADVAPVPVPQRPLSAGTSPAPAPGPGDPAVALYQQGLRLVRDRRFDEALRTLDQFLTAHGQHPYAASATYWRGEVYYARRQYRRALRQFERVVRSYPEASKVPDSLLKMGLCHRRMGDERRARSTFARLRERFPGSVAARLASQEDAS